MHYNNKTKQKKKIEDFEKEYAELLECVHNSDEAYLKVIQKQRITKMKMKWIQKGTHGKQD